jgi:hypothetical protein
MTDRQAEIVQWLKRMGPYDGILRCQIKGYCKPSQ